MVVPYDKVLEKLDRVGNVMGTRSYVGQPFMLVYLKGGYIAQIFPSDKAAGAEEILLSEMTKAERDDLDGSDERFKEPFSKSGQDFCNLYISMDAGSSEEELLEAMDEIGYRLEIFDKGVQVGKKVTLEKVLAFLPARYPGSF